MSWGEKMGRLADPTARSPAVALEEFNSTFAVTVNLDLKFFFFFLLWPSLIVLLSNHAEAYYSIHPTRSDCGAAGSICAYLHIQRAHHEEQSWPDGADLWLH